MFAYALGSRLKMINCEFQTPGLPIFDMTTGKDANTTPDLKNDSCRF